MDTLLIHERAQRTLFDESGFFTMLDEVSDTVDLNPQAFTVAYRIMNKTGFEHGYLPAQLWHIIKPFGVTMTVFENGWIWKR